MITRAFVISLQRSKARFANATEMLGKLPMDGQIMPAVDGSALTPIEISDVYQTDVHVPHYPFALRCGEVGCFLSHRHCWQAIVDQGLDAALILEDDVLFDHGVFADAIEFAGQHCPVDGYLQLPGRRYPKKYETVYANDSFSIVRTHVTMLRTLGQWVTRGAAERLLESTEVFDRPVDTTLQMHWVTGVRPLVLMPSGIRDATDEMGGSTIGDGKARRLNFEKLSREVNRTIYRARISRISGKTTVTGKESRCR